MTCKRRTSQMVTALTYTLVTRRLSGLRNTLEHSSGCGEMTALPEVRLGAHYHKTRHDSGLQCKQEIDNPQGVSQTLRRYFKQLGIGEA